MYFTSRFILLFIALLCAIFDYLSVISEVTIDV